MDFVLEFGSFGCECTWMLMTCERYLPPWLLIKIRSALDENGQQEGVRDGGLHGFVSWCWMSCCFLSGWLFLSLVGKLLLTFNAFNGRLARGRWQVAGRGSSWEAVR